MKLHITETALANLVVPQGKKWLVVHDTEQTGFAATKLASGIANYFIMYRNEQGKQKQEKLATVGGVSAYAARALARTRLGEINGRKAASGRTARKPACTTLADYFYAGYLPVVQANSRSHETHASLFRNHVNDQLGDKRLDEVSEEDILRFKLHLESKLVANGRWSKQATKTLSQGTVTRILILVRHLFNVAIRDKSAPLTHNPTYVVQLKTSRTMKGRFLTAEQLRRLLDAARQSQNTDLAEIIPIMGGTGLRRENVLAMEWQWLDWEAGALTVPASHDKAKKGFCIHLSQGVLHILRQREGNGSRWVFPSPKTGKPYCTCRGAWVVACSRAELDGLRMHDLRHTYASLMLESGADIIDVKNALAHTQLKTTEVYLHLRDARKRETANAAAMATGLFA